MKHKKKNTRKKQILRGIRHNLNRFLSILFIVALGSGFMAGLAATSPDMEETLDTYADDAQWYDLDLKATYGFKNADIQAIADTGLADILQGAKVMDMVLSGREKITYTSRVYGILDEEGSTELNRLTLAEGRFPKNSSECVIEIYAGRYADNAPELNDVLHITKEDNETYDSFSDYIAEDGLKVVGYVESPMCFSVYGESTNIGAGTLTMNVYTTSDFYTCDFYTDVFLTLTGAKKLDTFSDEYADLVEEATEILQDLAEEREPLRTEAIRDELNRQIEDAESIIDFLKSTNEKESLLYKDSQNMAGLTESLSALIPEKKNRKLVGLLKETAEKVQTAAFAGEDTEARIKEAEKGISEARDAIADLSDNRWIIRSREDSSSFSSYDSNVGKVAALSKIFPVFFFLVALLVALTTMTRLIEENRTETGTLKALGFTNNDILKEYLLFSSLASLLGCVLGFGAGFIIFPRAISSAYGMMYWLPETVTPFRLEIIAWVAPVTIISILLATLWACYDEFRSMPAALMQPKAPPAGKRIWLEYIGIIWKHMSFIRKVTARNLFRYKKRFFMTIIGVSGCSALLLTGFGLKDSINDIIDIQFGDLYRYELNALIDDEEAISEDEDLKAFLEDEDQVSSYLLLHSESAEINNSGTSVSITVPKDDELFQDFIRLRTRKTQEALSITEKGTVILSEKIAEECGVQIGDEITLENDDGQKAGFKVAGITEQYLNYNAYMTAETFMEAFGKAPEYKNIFCKLTDPDAYEACTNEILKSSRVLYARSSMSLKNSFSDSIKSIDGVILILILAAGLLSIVVLYNLTNVNICERRKELATIRVLGFTDRETQKYIFRETNILSFIGSVCGLGLGIWLHSYVIRTVEVDQVMFGRNIYPASYGIALGISIVFTLIVNLFMRRTISKVDMVEALKANE